MCGIIGSNFLTSNFDETINLLYHRGPDVQGSFTYKNNQFGHTRLSIIDLNEEASQPMIFDDIIITFNGEIYNYKELIEEEKLNCKTKSDTEVLIRLYQKYGVDFLNKLNGMFSFCIFDIKKEQFFCARDRFGKKPFYFYYKDDKFIYASEIKSIISLLSFTPTLNKKALEEYLTFWSPIGTNTFYKDILKLEAGYSIVFDGKKLLKNKYYDIDKIDLIHESEENVLDNIENLLIKSMERRLVSDVGVASLLSGGVDSSLVSSLYSKISLSKIDTYCIGYDEHVHYSELPYARKVAKYINSNHHEVLIGRNDFLEVIDNMLTHMDEPIGDSASIPTYILSKQISKDGFKVALSGEGSDEIFLGYDKYFNLLKTDSTYTTINASFSEEEKIKLFNEYLKKDYSSLSPYNSRIQNLSYLDIKIWIGDVLMTKIDKMSMAHSLELRAPFLDYHLVEYLLSIDESLKVGNTNKYLLKQIAYKYLPKDIVDRKKKGFSSPFIEWLYEEFKDEILNVILRVNRHLNLFNEEYVKFLYNEAKEKRYKQHVWNLFIFSRWFERVYL